MNGIFEVLGKNKKYIEFYHTGFFALESGVDKMVDSQSMAGPFALIPSQNLFESQACTAEPGATICLSIPGNLILLILYGGGLATCCSRISRQGSSPYS